MGAGSNDRISAVTKNEGHTSVQWLFRDPLAEYSFQRPLGAGHFGTTFAVVHRATGQEFACKVLNKLQRHFRAEDVVREVDTLRKLAGAPCVAQLVAVYEDKTRVYLVQELCRGGELFDVIADRGHLSEHDAAAVIRVVLDTVQLCHSHGILHRDLKPENFLLTQPLAVGEPLRPELIRAIDFGLSVQLDPSNPRRGRAGSSYYMAPEVLEGEYGFPADLWSAGVMTYILLTGMPPFWGDSDAEIFERIRTEPLDLQLAPWDEVSACAKDFVATLLQREPSSRPTVEQALQHPWLRANAEGDVAPLSGIVLERLRRFTGVSRLRALLMNVVARHLSDEHIGALRSVFAGMDADGSGVVSVAELRTALNSIGCTSDSADAEELLHRLDPGQHGHINYSSFIAAAVDKKAVLTERVLAHTFAELDQDGDGYVDMVELQAALAGCGIKVEAATLAALVAAEGVGDTRGRLTPDAFKRLMSAIMSGDLVSAPLESFLSGARRYARGAGLRRLALHALARRSDERELAELRQLFQVMDTGGTGQITFRQLAQALGAAGLRVDDAELAPLFEALDTDHDGLLRWPDFYAAALEQSAALSRAKMQAAFQFFDADGDGNIGLGELRCALRELMADPGEAEAVLKEADANADGTIDFDEFAALLRQAPPNLCTRRSTAASSMASQRGPVALSPMPTRQTSAVLSLCCAERQESVEAQYSPGLLPRACLQSPSHSPAAAHGHKAGAGDHSKPSDAISWLPLSPQEQNKTGSSCERVESLLPVSVGSQHAAGSDTRNACTHSDFYRSSTNLYDILDLVEQQWRVQNSCMGHIC